MTDELVTTIAKKASEIGKLAGLDAGTTPWLVNFYNLVMQEKYAQISQAEKTKIMAIKDLENALKRIIELEALLEQPAQRQPLTDEQIDRVTIEQWGNGAILAAHRAYAREIEAKLKEKRNA